jgi:protein tyrosine phosphatase (PTP) superfamily phosphohydrolase (DUF442 family)
MRIRGRLLAAVAAALALAMAVPGPLHTYLFESNLMPVIDGQVYRSAQPEPDELARWVETLGLRSIVNLRGERGSGGWLREERDLATSLGVAHYDVHLDADRMPPAPRLRELVKILDSAPRPLLFHCKGGVERSGLVGAVVVLLAGGDLDAARHQFDASKGFVPLVVNSDLPRVLDDYAGWLAAQGAASTPERFRTWVATAYAPDFYSAEIAPVDAPTALAQGVPQVLRFRVTNRSLHPIPFRAESGRGVHLGARLRPPEGSAERPLELRGDGVELRLEPGESTELALSLPALDGPGTWRLDVDLVDEGVKWFAAMGSEPLALRLLVRDAARG